MHVCICAYICVSACGSVPGGGAGVAAAVGGGGGFEGWCSVGGVEVCIMGCGAPRWLEHRQASDVGGTSTIMGQRTVSLKPNHSNNIANTIGRCLGLGSRRPRFDSPAVTLQSKDSTDTRALPA